MTQKWPSADWIPWRPTGSRCLPTTAFLTRCQRTNINTSTLPSRRKLPCRPAFPTFESSTFARLSWHCDGTLLTILIQTLKCTRFDTSRRDSRTMPVACSSTVRNRLLAASGNRLSTVSRCEPRRPTAGESLARPFSKQPAPYLPLMSTRKRIYKSGSLPALLSPVSSSSSSLSSSLFSICAGKFHHHPASCCCCTHFSFLDEINFKNNF